MNYYDEFNKQRDLLINSGNPGLELLTSQMNGETLQVTCCIEDAAWAEDINALLLCLSGTFLQWEFI